MEMKQSQMITNVSRSPKVGSSPTRRFSLLLWFLLVSGCGPSNGTVSGKVTFRGELVSDGTILVFAGGNVFEGEIQNGVYEISGVPPGEAKIAVIRLDSKQPDPYDALNKARVQMIERKAADPREINPDVITDPVQLELLQKKRHLLPFVYSSPNTSNLHLTIVAGANTFSIQLLERPTSE